MCARAHFDIKKMTTWRNEEKNRSREYRDGNWSGLNGIHFDQILLWANLGLKILIRAKLGSWLWRDPPCPTILYYIK